MHNQSHLLAAARTMPSMILQDQAFYFLSVVSQLLENQKSESFGVKSIKEIKKKIDTHRKFITNKLA
jgi:hypothetical protein